MRLVALRGALAHFEAPALDEIQRIGGLAFHDEVFARRQPNAAAGGTKQPGKRGPVDTVKQRRRGHQAVDQRRNLAFDEGDFVRHRRCGGFRRGRRGLASPATLLAIAWCTLAKRAPLVVSETTAAPSNVATVFYERRSRQPSITMPASCVCSNAPNNGAAGLHDAPFMQSRVRA